MIIRDLISGFLLLHITILHTRQSIVSHTAGCQETCTGWNKPDFCGSAPAQTFTF